jgi:predicted cupin superfamily sugar epimerase
VTTAQAIIAKLNLKPHPNEGGYFVETYRSRGMISKKHLPEVYSGDRAYSTAIYYLLTPETCSAMHRLPTDEVFHFYFGDPVLQLHLRPDGSSEVFTLGSDIEAGERPQLVVPGETWQGAHLIEGGQFALLGATVAPGFDSSDYEHGHRDLLCLLHPSRKDLIERLTPVVTL